MFPSEKLDSLICPYCKSDLITVNIDNSQSFGTLKCECDIYPLVGGIIYLRKINKINRTIVDFIEKRNYNKALTSLLSFSLRSKVFFYLTIRFPIIYKSLGYKNFTNLLKYLSLSKGWVNYLKNREQKPDFLIRLLTLNIINNQREYIIDLGCGSGYFFPYLYRHLDSAKVIGVDLSFLNLYFAKLFFAKKDTLLVCANLNRGIPVQNGNIDIVLTADTFNYLKEKKFFLTEIKRIMSFTGRACITHVVNTNSIPAGLEINPGVLSKMVKKLNLNFSLLSHKSIIQQLLKKKKVFFLLDAHLDSDHAYNIFLFKKYKPMYLYLPNEYKPLLIKFGNDIPRSKL